MIYDLCILLVHKSEHGDDTSLSRTLGSLEDRNIEKAIFERYTINPNDICQERCPDTDQMAMILMNIELRHLNV